MTLAPQLITRTIVADSERRKFLPLVFGAFPGFMIAEQSVYNMARHLMPDYKGGYWEFYHLTNGGAYLSLRYSAIKEVEVVVPDGNDYRGFMSPDAASIVVCLGAYSRLAADKTNPNRERYVDLYHALLDFARQHPEYVAIRAAID